MILTLRNVRLTMSGTSQTSININSANYQAKPWIRAIIHTTGIVKSHEYKFCNIILTDNPDALNYNGQFFRFPVVITEIWGDVDDIVYMFNRVSSSTVSKGRLSTIVEDFSIGISRDKLHDFKPLKIGSVLTLCVEFFKDMLV